MGGIVVERLVAHQFPLPELMAHDEVNFPAIDTVVNPNLVLGHPGIDVAMSALSLVGFLVIPHEMAVDDQTPDFPQAIGKFGVVFSKNFPRYIFVRFAISKFNPVDSL